MGVDSTWTGEENDAEHLNSLNTPVGSQCVLQTGGGNFSGHKNTGILVGRKQKGLLDRRGLGLSWTETEEDYQ